ncbi:MAG: C-GCAxxG-C-C family (seleno)protein [Bacillota bacterium]
MIDYTLRAAIKEDFESIASLLMECGLPTAGVLESLDNFIVADNGSVVGVVGMEISGTSVMLRSLAVKPEFRNTGIGKALVDILLKNISHRELQDVYLMTGTAAEYMARWGFIKTDRSAMPSSLLVKSALNTACPSCSTCMKLELGGIKMSKSDTALSLFNDGSLCSQSVFGAFCDELGLERETAMKLATPFGGGMARAGDTCGAVTGALMVIGLKHGNMSNWKTEDRQKEKAYEITNQFFRLFKDRHGSVFCRDLLGCDISTPEGRQKANDHQLFVTACPRFVRDAAEILEKII